MGLIQFELALEQLLVVEPRCTYGNLAEVHVVPRHLQGVFEALQSQTPVDHHGEPVGPRFRDAALLR
jgi:hypothetical protein